MSQQSEDTVRDRVQVQAPPRLGLLIGVTLAALLAIAGFVVVSSLNSGSDIAGTLQGHLGPITGVAWSPDGSRIATSSYDSTARVWDAASNSIAHTLQHDGLVTGVAWSPDSKRLVTGSRAVKVWNAEGGQEEAVLEGHLEAIDAVAWSPDGKYIAAASDNVVWVWDAATRETVSSFTLHTEKVRKIAFSPDGQSIASVSDDGTARVWDAASSSVLTALSIPQEAGPANSVVWAPDGATLATASNDYAIRIWDAESGNVVRTLTGHGGIVTNLAYSPDGKRLASGSTDSSLRLWDPVGGANVATLTGPFWAQGPVGDISWAPDGSQIAAATKSEIKIWSVAGK